MTPWPVYLWSVVQEDSVRVFERGDVVTLPVELVDAAAEPGWPGHLGVSTTVRLTTDDRGRRWANAPDLSALTRLTGPTGPDLPIRAALAVKIQTTSLMSFVTGTVRRIEMASVPAPELGDPATPVRSSERWELTETPVAPVRFRHPFGPRRSETWDHGMLIHLDVFTPRCRCRDVSGLQGPEAIHYAQRHLRATAVDIEAGITRYRCLETDITWISQPWKPRGEPGHLPGVRHGPSVLTQQPS